MLASIQKEKKFYWDRRIDLYICNFFDVCLLGNRCLFVPASRISEFIWLTEVEAGPAASIKVYRQWYECNGTNGKGNSQINQGINHILPRFKHDDLNVSETFQEIEAKSKNDHDASVNHEEFI
jgi:hypothetical protein